MASRRLGEILIAADLVSPEVWEQAMREEAMGRGPVLLVLLRRGVPAAPIAQAICAAGAEFHPATRLANLDPDLIARIPAPIATRWGVLPVLARSDLLKVVMLDPFDPLSLQTLAEVTGARIEAGCSDPLRLARAVDRAHGSTLSAGLPDDTGALPLPTPPPPSHDPIPITLRRSAPGSDDDIEVLEPATGELADLFGEAPPAAPPPVAAVRAPPPPSTWSAAGPLSPPTQPTEKAPEVAPGQTPEPSSEPSTFARIALDSLTPSAVADAPAKRIEAPAEVSPPDLKEDFDFAIIRLRVAETRDELGEAAILFLARCFPRAAILSVRGQTITGWLAGGELLSEQVEVIKIEIGQPTLFWGVLETRRPFIGPLPAGRETLLELLITPPRQLAVFPVCIGEHPVALLYGDTVDTRPILARRDLLERLADELGEALGELILKQKTDNPPGSDPR